ncbi:MAG: GSCFA domain-containing protein [Maribacter sp.]
MNLQTKILVPRANNQIGYDSQLLLLGSCFSQNIGNKLDYFKFRSLQNPFGILFNPRAIENLVERAVEKKIYSETDLFFQNERWHTFDAHSDMSLVLKGDLLATLNSNLVRTRNQIEKATHIIITLGTAWVYRHKKSQKIVANCHKIPQKEFDKSILPISETTASLKNIIERIQSVNTNAQIVFTISPVRHLKDGFVENQISKSRLITAVHEIIGVSPTGAKGIYFPSYEVMMDELRDYRFYAQDMIHPNQLAIDYVWEKFKEVWVLEDAYKTMGKVEDIQKGLRHKPFHPESEQHQKFKKSLQAKIAYINGEYPFMDFN